MKKKAYLVAALAAMAAAAAAQDATYTVNPETGSLASITIEGGTAKSYQRRAENIVRNNLCQFFEDGSASCAFVNPRMVDGQRAHRFDAFANDQDWALVFYLLVNHGA